MNELIVSLHFVKSGNGPSVLLIHGNGETHHIFDTLSKQLQNAYTVYAIDSRNHGDSPKSDDYCYEIMAQDTSVFIQSIIKEPVNIIGFSDGAIIATMMALNHPELIKKMMLLGMNLSPNDFKSENLEYLQTLFKKTQDPLVELMLTSPQIPLETLSKINIPILIVSGENDLFKDELFVSLTNTLPDAKQLIMMGHDHSSYVIDNDILWPYVESFFSTDDTIG